MNKEQLSRYMSELSKKRKHPHLPFKDKQFASKAGKLGGEATQRKYRETEQAVATKGAPKSKNKPKSVPKA